MRPLVNAAAAAIKHEAMQARSYFIGFVVAVVAVAALGCPEHGSSATDATATATSATANATGSQVTLAPLVDTASAAPGASALLPLVETATAPKPAKPVATATATTTHGAKAATPSAQAQLRSCCVALRKQAGENPSQGAQLGQAAAVCDGLVAAMAGAGSSATMPELAPVKGMLQGLSLPPICEGL